MRRRPIAPIRRASAGNPGWLNWLLLAAVINLVWDGLYGLGWIIGFAVRVVRVIHGCG